MKKLRLCPLVLVLFLTACSSNSTGSNTSKQTPDTQANNTTSASTNNSDSNNNASSTNNSSEANKNNQNTAKNNSDSSSKKTTTPSSTAQVKSYTDQEITEKTKNYILNGQGNKAEAEKLNWSKTFLEKVNIPSLYKKYVTNGGKKDDVASFAAYMTKNAPIQNNWQDLFKKDLQDTYGEKVARIEHLQGDSYQAYVQKEGKEVPFVVVSARTGYFHG
ncbi:hypothetical protein [Clostridium manihotivorum]|uniref:Lipoprotein n=1 Tax=Clostridium manihotivorum TaxID=2320868 RepID=A0A410DWL3_9CLOT|nr:hypothetical protein [Clostridium manihotivorum]QAA33479.1 hypothetical protein C1I91_18510 [Clostridium manihotivorum]